MSVAKNARRSNDQIVSYFTDRILSGELTPGEKIPSEHNLCAQFGSSRAVIREAIQQLKARGMVVTLNGKGSYIAEGEVLDVQFVHGPGEAYAADTPFDVAMCVGASWIWHGWQGTLEALCAFVKPGGRIVTGEPYWIGEPPDRYLAMEGLRRDEFPTFEAYVEGALAMGLLPVWMRRSTTAECRDPDMGWSISATPAPRIGGGGPFRDRAHRALT